MKQSPGRNKWLKFNYSVHKSFKLFQEQTKSDLWLLPAVASVSCEHLSPHSTFGKYLVHFTVCLCSCDVPLSSMHNRWVKKCTIFSPPCASSWLGNWFLLVPWGEGGVTPSSTQHTVRGTSEGGDKSVRTLVITPFS